MPGPNIYCVLRPRLHTNKKHNLKRTSSVVCNGPIGYCDRMRQTSLLPIRATCGMVESSSHVKWVRRQLTPAAWRPSLLCSKTLHSKHRRQHWCGIVGCSGTWVKTALCSIRAAHYKVQLCLPTSVWIFGVLDKLCRRMCHTWANDIRGCFVVCDVCLPRKPCVEVSGMLCNVGSASHWDGSVCILCEIVQIPRRLNSCFMTTQFLSIYEGKAHHISRCNNRLSHVLCRSKLGVVLCSNSSCSSTIPVLCSNKLSTCTCSVCVHRGCAKRRYCWLCYLVVYGAFLPNTFGRVIAISEEEADICVWCSI